MVPSYPTAASLQRASTTNQASSTRRPSATPVGASTRRGLCCASRHLFASLATLLRSVSPVQLSRATVAPLPQPRRNHSESNYAVLRCVPCAGVRTLRCGLAWRLQAVAACCTLAHTYACAIRRASQAGLVDGFGHKQLNLCASHKQHDHEFEKSCCIIKVSHRGTCKWPHVSSLRLLGAMELLSG